MLIYEFQKNALEKVVIEITEHLGKKYLNLRVWFDASKGQNTDWRPSQRGITLSVDLIQMLQAGIDKAAYLLVQDQDFLEQEEKEEKKEGQLNLPDPETKKSKKKKREDFAGSNGEIPF